jgi:hypothetical protein
MPGITLQQLKNIGDVTQKIRWNFIVSQFPALAPYDSDTLNIRCISSNVPKLVLTNTEIKLRGFTVNQNGSGAPEGPITITFIETVDNAIKSWFKAWRDASWNQETGVSAPKVDLQAVIILQQLDNQNNAIYQYEMKGCILESYDPVGGDLDGESTDGSKPTITIKYDYFKDGPIV